MGAPGSGPDCVIAPKVLVHDAHIVCDPGDAELILQLAEKIQRLLETLVELDQTVKRSGFIEQEL